MSTVLAYFDAHRSLRDTRKTYEDWGRDNPRDKELVEEVLQRRLAPTQPDVNEDANAAN